MKRKNRSEKISGILLLLVIGFSIGLLVGAIMVLTNTDDVLTNNGYISKDKCNLKENITEIYKYKCNEYRLKWGFENIYTGEIQNFMQQYCEDWYYEKEVIIQK